MLIIRTVKRSLLSTRTRLEQRLDVAMHEKEDPVTEAVDEVFLWLKEEYGIEVE